MKRRELDKLLKLCTHTPSEIVSNYTSPNKTGRGAGLIGGPDWLGAVSAGAVPTSMIDPVATRKHC